MVEVRGDLLPMISSLLYTAYRYVYVDKAGGAKHVAMGL